MKKTWKQRFCILFACFACFTLAACEEDMYSLFNDTSSQQSSKTSTKKSSSSKFSSKKKSSSLDEDSSSEEGGEELSSVEEQSSIEESSSFEEQSSIEESSSFEEQSSIEESSSFEEQSSIEESSSEEEISSEENSSSVDEDSSTAEPENSPAAGEIARDLTPPTPSEQYSYQTYEALGLEGAWYCCLYNDFYNAAVEFHSSTEDYTEQVKTVTYKDSETNVVIDAYQCFTVATIDYAKYYTDSAKTTAVTVEQCISVWGAFSQENPYFFWIDRILCGEGEGKVAFVADADYATSESREQAKLAVNGMVDECASYLCEGMNETEIALTIYDYLAWKMEYAYVEGTSTPDPSQSAHCLAGAATGKGVCEAYAHAYDYLCGVFGIDCMTVVGEAGENTENSDTLGGHAWNYVCIDGSWYVVDVTWGDPYAASEAILVREWFGEYGDNYVSTHLLSTPTIENGGVQVENWGADYQVEMPTLGGELCPVLFGREGEEKIMLPNIESALALMEEGGRYEIILYPSTTVIEGWTGVTLLNDYATLSVTDLPNVEKITFIGGVGENGYLIVDPSIDRTKIALDGIDLYTLA